MNRFIGGNLIIWRSLQTFCKIFTKTFVTKHCIEQHNVSGWFFPILKIISLRYSYMVEFLLIRSKSSTVKFFEIQMPEILQNLWRSKEKYNTSKEFPWNVGLKKKCVISQVDWLRLNKQAWKSYAKTFYQTMPERITERCGLLKQDLPAPWANKAAADEGSSVVCETSMLLSIAASEKVSELVIIFITRNEQFFSHIMARTSYILMRWWWWCPLCTKPTCLVGFLWC